MKRKIIFTVIIALALAAAIGAAIGTFIRDNKTTKNTKIIYYTLPMSPSPGALANDLSERGIIKNRFYFLLISKYRHLEGNIRNTRLMIKPETNLSELIERLMAEKPEFTMITIPEGFRLYQIGDRLEKNKMGDKNTFMSLSLKDIDSEALAPGRKDVLWDMEGFLFPDTYFIPSDFSEKDIAQLMNNRFKEVFTEKYIDRAKEMGLSVNEVVTVASLIEREAITDEERSRIAGVIYNRLKKGMPLQIDAAVIYANTKGLAHLTRVLYSHLKYDSKYNCYLYKGLPPGPIANPGRPSIEAALYPEQHDYLYYVAGEKGHVFSKTYEEHLSNVKKYMKK